MYKLINDTPSMKKSVPIINILYWYLDNELVQDEFSLWLDRSEEAKLAVRDTLGEVFSDPVSLLEVVWFEPRDSTDQEDRSNDLHRHIFRITSFVIYKHSCFAGSYDNQNMDCSIKYRKKNWDTQQDTRYWETASRA
jgi:hypothetical protein